MGRLEFLFSSGRLPFFIVKTQVYFNQAKDGYNNLKNSIKNFLKKKM